MKLHLKSAIKVSETVQIPCRFIQVTFLFQNIGEGVKLQIFGKNPQIRLIIRE